MGWRPRSAGLASGLALALAGLVGVAPAAADEIDRLQRRVDALEGELGRVKAQQSELAEAREKADGRGMTIKTKPGLVIESEDKSFSAKVGGRIMADGAWYDDDVTELGDGTEFRRVRLFVSGTLYRDWAYKVQYDFTSSGRGGIRDAYIKYKGLAPTALTVGNFKVPFSLEELTSSKYVTFMERALPNVFAPGRRIGAGAGLHGDNWTASAGLFGDAVGGDIGGEGDEPWEVGGRVTFAPFHEKTRSLHVGAGGVYAGLNDDTLRFRQRPESHITGIRFVDTGTIAEAQDYYRIGPELAAVWGPFSVQGEYMHVGIDRNAFEDVDFSGWYVEASWFLTGESRAYKPKKGTFGRVKPKHNLGAGGYGAWQIGARYSALDLTDEDVLGGEEDNVTVGINWHVNPYVRFMVNAIWVDTDENALGGDEDAFIGQVRAQLDF